jgi:hypothetical protein
VFRLYDPQSGQAKEIKPDPGGLLLVRACRPAPGRPVPANTIRTLLLADLIGRNAEHRHHLTVLASLVTGPGQANSADDDADEAFWRELAVLNLRPPQAARAPQTASPLSSGEIIVGNCRVRTGPVRFEGRELDAAGVDTTGLDTTGLDTTGPQLTLSGLAERGLDPLALRLAFLSGRYTEPADLTWNALSDANLMLRRWRERVAEWAESPSKPMCAEVTARLRAALDEDLDTPAALQALGELERDPEIPPGSKFESFLDADQLLALDLPSQIGRAPLRRNNSSS